MDVLIGILNQIKMFHWLTLEYNAHIILDELYDTMSGLVDQYVESALGDDVVMGNVTVSLHTDTERISDSLRNMYNTLTKMRKSCKSFERSVILDDMLLAFSKSMYLMRMH